MIEAALFNIGLLLAASASPALAEQPAWRIAFKNQDVITGLVLEVSPSGKVRVRSPSFQQEIETEIFLVGSMRAAETTRFENAKLPEETIMLLDGERLPARVLKMDGESLYLEPSPGNQIPVPRQNVKAVYFNGTQEALGPYITTITMIRTPGGDVLAGDVVSMDEREVIVKNFLGELRIGRKRLEYISFPFEKRENSLPEVNGGCVRLSLPGGNYLTGILDRIENGQVVLSHSLLGQVRFEQQSILEILFLEGRPFVQGHLLVALRDRVLEIDREGKVLWTKVGFNDVLDAHRLRTGNTWILDQQEGLVEIDPSGRKIRTVLEEFEDAGHSQPLWDGQFLLVCSDEPYLRLYNRQATAFCSLGEFQFSPDVQLLPSGRLLVVETYEDGETCRVCEMDLEGKVLSERQISNISSAQMTSDGNLLTHSGDGTVLSLHLRDGTTRELYQTADGFENFEPASDGGFYVVKDGVIIRFDIRGKEKWRYLAPTEIRAIHEI